MTGHPGPTFGTTLAERYDRHLVPLLFAPYADDIAARVRMFAPRSVLELAAGTGVLTRALASTLPAGASIVATDISMPMIDRARSKIAEGIVTWQQADAMHLPFSNGVFDLVVYQFGVMFFPDKVASFLEAARVLKPGGRYLFAVWDDWAKMSEAPLSIAAEVVSDVLGCDPAGLVNPPYHDETVIRQDLEAAHFPDVRVDHVELPADASSAREAAIATVRGSLIRTVIEERFPDRLDEATMAVEDALRAKFGRETVAGRTRASIVTARTGR